MAQIIIWNSFNENVNVLRPMGPHALAGWLRENGFTAKVIDFCHTIPTEKLVDITKKHIDNDTVAIGVSSTFWKPTPYSNRQHKDYYSLKQDTFYEPEWVRNARDILEPQYQKLEWIIGGHTGVGHMGKVNRYKWHIIRGGYAEDSILKFMEEKTGKTASNRFFDIKAMGPCFSKDDSIVASESLPIELARGCQFKCKFCSYPMIGKKPGTYTRTESYLEDELLRNYEMFGTTRYQIMDDTVNESMEKIEMLANVVSRLPFKFEWIGYNRLDLIGTRADAADLLKASGLKSTYFGIESFHPEASTCVGKGWNGKHGKDFLLKLRDKWKDDVSITCSFIAGLPYETEQSVRDTHDWLVETGVVDTWFYLQLFLRKNNSSSEFERNAADYGIVFPKENDKDYWEHPTSNFADAIKLSQELNYEKRRLDMVKPMCWYIPIYANLGYEYDEVRHTRVADLKWTEMALRHKAFISKYIREQLQ